MVTSSIVGVSNILKLDAKEKAMYIYKGYINTRPAQSNIFGNILRSYREDMLSNADNVVLQKRAIEDSLHIIFDRYGYREVTLQVEVSANGREFEIDITAIDIDGISIKLSDSLIIEDNS